jgi:hypothetical protein
MSRATTARLELTVAEGFPVYTGVRPGSAQEYVGSITAVEEVVAAVVEACGIKILVIAAVEHVVAAAPIDHVVAVQCNDDISLRLADEAIVAPVPTSVARWLWQFAPRAFPAPPKKARAQIAAMQTCMA